MRRLASLLAAACLGTAALLWFAAPTASAATPDETGWWTSLNPGSTLGSPTPPPPPDVPNHGLVVQGGPDSSPTALAAVVYQLPAGATAGQLTLTVAPNSATTPASQLELCPLANPVIIGEDGGPMSDAPIYRCEHKLTGAPTSDGKRYQFNVSMLTADGELAVAILPTTQTDRVVLAAPGKNSLTIEPAFTASGPGTSTSSGNGGTSGVPPGANGPATSNSGAGAPQATGVAPSLPATGSASVTGQAPQVASTQAAAPATPGFQPSAFTPSTSRTKPIAVVLVIAAVLIGGGLWEAAGRSASRAALNSARGT